MATILYTKLLETALDKVHDSDQLPTTGEALAELLRCRGQLGAGTSPRLGSGGVVGNVTDQLAYDIALIGLARCLGIDCDLHNFGPPQHERALLEGTLAAQGICLDNFDEQAQPKWGKQ
jgi:hypothetical protein